MPKMTELASFDPSSNWAFVNGKWVRGPDGTPMVPRDAVRTDGDAIQGHHYAFYQATSFDDMAIKFDFRLQPHSDIGVILRASSPSDFYLVHFPNCGQASRAKHFWAAISRMDQGYLRLLVLRMIRRVPSTCGMWLSADLRVDGDGVDVDIGTNGSFRARDLGMPPAGGFGLYAFGSSEMRSLNVRGHGRPHARWNPSLLPPRNWFHPAEDTEYGLWQRPGDLLRTPGGDLLLHYGVQERPYAGKITQLTMRSRDGLSWSSRRPLPEAESGSPHLHIFPDGEMRLAIQTEDSLVLMETADDGTTWHHAERAKLPVNPPGVKRLHIGPQAFLNLNDGSILMFGYGQHESTTEGSSIFTWSSHHCQAFSSRSEDGGLIWSDWVNLDGETDYAGNLVPGSLDFTEVCATQTRRGDILALIRPIYSPWMWETWSHDGGRTWSPCVRGPFPGYATPNMLRMRSGALLVAHRLPGCTINRSVDDGRTWDEGTMIDSAIWVMGSMLEVEDGVALYVYWDSFESLMRAQLIQVAGEGLVPLRRR